jgi:L-fuconolactonase
MGGEDSRLRALRASGENARVRIDAHQHFWRFDARELGWIDGRMGRIRRDFLAQELWDELARAGFDGCVAVQARSSEAETDFLLDLAREHPFVRAVVGWVDLQAEDAPERIARLARAPRLRGLRHIVQDEPDPGFLERPAFRRGVAAMARHGLVYDLLIVPRQLAAAQGFVAAHAGQPIVLDHLAKPEIARRARHPWERELRALGRFPHLACKVSGLVTEAAWMDWRPAEFTFYLDVALEAFGEDRLLFGSDWPVCLVAAESYAQVLELVADWSERLTPEGRRKLFGLNAVRVYGLA